MLGNLFFVSFLEFSIDVVLDINIVDVYGRLFLFLVVLFDCFGLVLGLVLFVLLVLFVDEIEIVGVGMLVVVVEVVFVFVDVFVVVKVCVNVIGVFVLFGIEVFVVVSVLVVIVVIVVVVESFFKIFIVENDKFDVFMKKFLNRIFLVVVLFCIVDFMIVFNEELVIFLFLFFKMRIKLIIMFLFLCVIN